MSRTVKAAVSYRQVSPPRKAQRRMAREREEGEEEWYLSQRAEHVQRSCDRQSRFWDDRKIVTVEIALWRTSKAPMEVSSQKPIIQILCKRPL